MVWQEWNDADGGKRIGKAGMDWKGRCGWGVHGTDRHGGDRCGLARQVRNGGQRLGWEQMGFTGSFIKTAANL